MAWKFKFKKYIFFYFLRENVEFVISSIMYLSFWLLLSIDVSNLKKEPQNVKYCQPSVFLPTCPNPKSSGSWLHFLHWMMIFLCVRLETAYLWTLWSHWQKATDWRFFWPRSFDCSWVVPAVSHSSWGHFLLKILSKLSFAPKVSPSASVDSRSCSAFSLKDFLLRSTSN